MNERERQRPIVVHNREAVIEALRRGNGMESSRRLAAGFYAGKGQKPFDVEKIGEFFIPATSEDCFAFQLWWLEAIRRA